MAEYQKKRFVAEGTVCVKGKRIPYTATSEDFPIRAADGKTDASIFMFSYERTDVEKDGRPVLFAWNGGPGSASVYLHMGMIAPKRLKCGERPEDLPQVAPFELVNNDNCLLDVCDTVVVDAIGTGYSRLLDQSRAEEYTNLDGDAAATVVAMSAWLTAHKRWNSPVYILGESYGTIRTALVAEALYGNERAVCGGVSLQLAGIINLGSALNHAQEDFPIPREVMNLPSIAAANWYHHPEGKGTLKEFVLAANEFAYGDYLRAIALGRRLPEEEQRKVAERLSELTALPVKKLMENKLRINTFVYPAEVFAEEGKAISIYDARFSLGRFKNPAAFNFGKDDAAAALGNTALIGAFRGIWRDALNIDTDEEYECLAAPLSYAWKYNPKTYPPIAVEQAMYRNPKLKLMFGMGIYDMLTTMGWVHYLVNHFDYPQDRTWLTYYPSGHMPYISDSCAYGLQEDIKRFILAEKNEEGEKQQ